MIKEEKLIFWLLLVIFIGVLIFGFLSQENKKRSGMEFFQEIELASKKNRVHFKVEKSKWDIATLIKEETLESYKGLLKRSPFFKIGSDTKVKKVEPIVIKEEPKEPLLKYKGRVTMESKVLVIIEDEGTGKSHFVQVGDMVGDFLVQEIDETKVVLKKKGGEEIILSAIKKEDISKEIKTEEKAEK